ncbi:MAG: hypothetical protein KBD78_06790 [Oligoflexales bacterium]|nr:hypothetical protein [Oligoflexales bacterium]
MKNSIPFCIILIFVAGCKHYIHSSTVEDVKRNMVEVELHKHCDPNSCSVRRCWMEMEDVVFCIVEFSFFWEWDKEKIISKMADSLHMQGLKNGLCGKNSIGTRVSLAFLGVLNLESNTTALRTSNTQSRYGYNNTDDASNQLKNRIATSCLEGVVLIDAMEN